MLVAPETFYWRTPGVALTGPYNSHFVRDAALAFLCSGGAIGWGAAIWSRPLMIAGAAWPAAHALFHLQIWVARGCAPDRVAFFDWIGVIAPAALAFGLALCAKPRDHALKA